jgi:hypothetical protein
MFKNLLIKSTLVLSAFGISVTILAPASSAFAATQVVPIDPPTQSTPSNEQYSLSKSEMDQIIERTVSDIKNDAPVADTGENKEGKFQSRSAASLIVKLAKIYGKHYVKSVLPKKIYKAVPRATWGSISEDAFVGFWNAYVLLGPLDEVHDSVTNYLVKHGAWHWAASSAGYIAQGIVYALV